MEDKMLTSKRKWLVLIAAIAIICLWMGLLYLLGWFRGSANALQTWNIGTPVNAIAFSPDGKLLAVGLNSGDIQLRKPSDGSIVLTLNEPASDKIALAFSPDGRLLASGTSGGDAPIYLWQINDTEAPVNHAALGRDSIS